ncbi:MAG: DnaJ C-terminal domain-containing protein [Myxococcota bacterium]
MAERPDYYAVLGVPRDAETLRIKQAYRRLAARYHPDRHGGARDATGRFQALVEAYSVLGDAERRRAYDEGQAIDAVRIEPGTPLEELFGRMVDQLFGVRSRRAVDGRDVRYRLDVDLAEVAHGCARTLRLPREVPCGACDGRGFPLESLPEICERCGGRGEIQRRRVLRSTLENCPDCEGRGFHLVTACVRCEGSGTRVHREPLTIDVPAGVEDGRRLVVRGGGQPGRNGGRDGDCLVTVRVRPHPALERRGSDVLLERPVSVFEATAGGWLDVPTVDGEQRLKLPVGIEDGAVLRMQGRGLADSRGERGDQLVTIRVEMPQDLDEDIREALRRLGMKAGRGPFPKTRRFEAEALVRRVAPETSDDG